MSPTHAAHQLPSRAAVVGAGAWGTTFASLLAEAGAPTTVWARRQEVAAEINSGTNSRYAPSLSLPPEVRATTDMRAAVAGAGIVLGTRMRMSEVLAQVLGVPGERVAVVSGPNLADEIAVRQPTATVVASSSQDTAAAVAAACATATFRPYTNNDVLGVELCGAVKNVIALAVGMAAGRGLGDNSKATLITRGLVEITRLGLALGARPETFSGLAGMGDLVATCSSPLSRNQSFGRRLGEGMSVARATAVSRGVAEGAKSARAVLDLADTHGVEMPITAGVVAVVEGRASVSEVSDALLSRPRKAEGVNAAPL